MKNSLTYSIVIGFLWIILCTSTSFALGTLNPDAEAIIPQSPPTIKDDTPKAILPIYSYDITAYGRTYWSAVPWQGTKIQHSGIDLDSAYPLVWVRSIDRGLVRKGFPQWYRDKITGQIMPDKFFGYYIIIDPYRDPITGLLFSNFDKPKLYGHLDGTTSAAQDIYNNLRYFPNVYEDQTIGILGATGNTGNPPAPHLHFQFGDIEPGPGPNPLKIWTEEASIAAITAQDANGNSIPQAAINPKDGIHNSPFIVLQPKTNGVFPSTIDIDATIATKLKGSNTRYPVRAVLYFDQSRMSTYDQLTQLDTKVNFPSIKLANLTPGAVHTITVTYFDTEAIMLDTPAYKKLFTESAATDPIARADVDLYVPEDLKPTATPGSPYEGDSIAFGLTAPTLGSGQYTYQWDFGDGGADSGPTPYHSYAVAGTYVVKVLATDSNLHQIVALGKVQVTVQKKKKPDPNPQPGLPGGPGGSLPGGPWDPNGPICGSPCGVLGGWLNYLSGKVNAAQLLTFLNSGVKVNPNPKCSSKPYSDTCGYYGEVMYTIRYFPDIWYPTQGQWLADIRGPYFAKDKVSLFGYPEGRSRPPDVIHNPIQNGDHWVHNYTWSNNPKNPNMFKIPCDLPADVTVPEDLFTGNSPLPDGDYISADGHLITMANGKAQDMGLDTKGPNGTARKPGFYPANGQSCG